MNEIETHNLELAAGNSRRILELLQKQTELSEDALNYLIHGESENDLDVEIEKWARGELAKRKIK